MEFFAVRDKDGRLKAYLHDNVLKNKGKGYWISEYNSKSLEIPLKTSEFPEITWDDAKPTRLELVNPLAEVDGEQLPHIPNTIEVTVEGSSSQYNNTKSAKCTVFVNNISFISPTTQGDFKTIIHTKGGETIFCVETVYKIHKLISETCHENC